MRKFFASLFLFLFFLISGPILLLNSFLFSYGSINILRSDILPESYELVMPILAKNLFASLPRELTRSEAEETLLEKLKEVFPRETYVDLGSQALKEFFQGIRVQKGALEVELKETRRILVDALTEVSQEFPSSFPEVEKSFLLQNLREEIEANIPSRFTFVEGAEEDAWKLQNLSWLIEFLRENFQMIRFGFLAVLFLPLILMGLILWRPLSRVFRYEAWAFIFAGLEAFGLFWLFRQFPLLLERAAPIGLNISEPVKMAIEFFLSFPSKMLFGISLALITVGIIFFILSFRVASKKQVVEENSQTPITIRPGKLRKGSGNDR